MRHRIISYLCQLCASISIFFLRRSQKEPPISFKIVLHWTFITSFDSVPYYSGENEVKIGLLIALWLFVFRKICINILLGSRIISSIQPFQIKKHYYCCTILWALFFSSFLFWFVIFISTFEQYKIKMKLVAIEKWAVL